MVNGESKKPDDASQLSYYWHVHATNDVGDYHFGYSKPSDTDKQKQQELKNNGYSGYGIVVGERDKTVSFYNGRKLILQLQYKAFRSICK